MRCLLFTVVLIWPSLALAEDWSSCESDLNSLQMAASSASDAASQADSNADDLEDCQTFPDTYDLYDDDCQTVQGEYDDAVSDLEGELETVNMHIRSVALSCGTVAATIVVPSTQGSGDALCNLYRRYAGRLPGDTLMKQCLQSKSQRECNACLDSK